MANLPYSSASNAAFGGVVLTINSQAHVARNWGPEFPSRKARRDDENGDQAAFMLRAEPAQQSGLVLQVANTNVANTIFVGNVFTGPDAVEYVITRRSRAKPQGEFHTVTIDIESTAVITD